MAFLVNLRQTASRIIGTAVVGTTKGSRVRHGVTNGPERITNVLRQLAGRPHGLNGPSRRFWWALLIIATGAGAALGLTYVVYWALSGQGSSFDFHAYWIVDPSQPYVHQGAGAIDAFQYPPAAALIAPLLRLIPYAIAIVIWRLLQVGSIVATAGPWSVLVLLTFPVASELNLGNINLFIGLIVVAGFRWPALWALVLLTKPTTGVALLWFVVRGDWRSLKIILGLTAAIAAISFALTPDAWIAYAEYMLGTPAPAVQGYPVLWLRLPFAVLVAIVSGRKGWRPGMLISAWLALPVWWHVSPSVLVAGLAYTWPSALKRLTAPTGKEAGEAHSVDIAAADSK